MSEKQLRAEIAKAKAHAEELNEIEKAKRKQNLMHYLGHFAQKDSELDKKARKTEAFGVYGSRPIGLFFQQFCRGVGRPKQPSTASARVLAAAEVDLADE